MIEQVNLENFDKLPLTQEEYEYIVVVSNLQYELRFKAYKKITNRKTKRNVRKFIKKNDDIGVLIFPFLKDAINCDWCDAPVIKPKHYSYFLSPFNDEDHTIDLCPKCYTHFLDNGIEDNYLCEECSREIVYSNGYRINIRFNQEINDEYWEKICVSCLQKLWFEHGMPNFKDADFFSYDELEFNGYTKYNDYFCNSGDCYKKVEEIFNKLQEDHKVIVDINSCGMGLEHHLSLYVKKI